jgi:phage shock protein PspC (stress-responsive transcriptional regulator)
VAKRLVRDTRRAAIGGVAAGFAEYLDVDPALVRVAFVLLVFANGLGLLAYLVCWLVMPRGDVLQPAPGAADGPPTGATAGTGFETLREAGDRIAAEVRKAAPDTAQAQAVVGSFLVVGGALLLAHNLGWLHWPYWLTFDTLWPLLLVALGVGLILKSRRSTTAA